MFYLFYNNYETSYTNIASWHRCLHSWGNYAMVVNLSEVVTTCRRLVSNPCHRDVR